MLTFANVFTHGQNGFSVIKVITTSKVSLLYSHQSSLRHCLSYYNKQSSENILSHLTKHLLILILIMIMK